MGAPSSPLSGMCSTQGRPNYQHDRTVIETIDGTTVYAVADGHGSAETGHLVSQFCATNLTSTFRRQGVFSPTASPHAVTTGLETAIRRLDTACIRHTTAERQYAGSTLCTVLRKGDTLYCANVGDSRAVVVSCPSPSTGSPRGTLVTPLSRDHVCTDAVELQRISAAGGIVVGKLLNGYISMSRALGDDDLKAHRNITKFPIAGSKPEFSPQLFTGEADVTRRRVGREDAVCLLASDGVWNVLSNNSVGKVVAATVLQGGDADSVARAVVKKALAKGSKDNVTAVAFFLWDVDGTRALVRQAASKKARGKGRVGSDVGEHRRHRKQPLAVGGGGGDGGVQESKVSTMPDRLMSPVTPASGGSGFEAESSSADTVDLMDDMDSCGKLRLDFGLRRKGMFAYGVRGEPDGVVEDATPRVVRDRKESKWSTARRPGAWRKRLTSSLKKS